MSAGAKDPKAMSFTELVDDLGRLLREREALVERRCVDCGSPDTMFLRCRICEEQHQRELATYRRGP